MNPKNKDQQYLISL